MSGPDQSDEDKRFFARWSQRKQKAKQPVREAPVAKADVPSEPDAESHAEQEVDLSSLPKLEDLTAATDISPFLRRGVPEHLRNAALRKSWALDPAVRNYVNPALEYAYDWNTPGGVPGNSEIGAGIDVARLVSQIMGTGEPAVEPSISAAETRIETTNDPGQSSEQTPDLPSQPLRLSGQASAIGQEPSNEEEGTRLEAGQTGDPKASDSAASQQAVRRHGSAKPII